MHSLNSVFAVHYIITVAGTCAVIQ